MRRTLLPLSFLLACTGKEEPVDSTPPDPCPVAAWSPSELTWADLTLGEAATQGVTLTNDCDGEATLHLALAVEGAAFTVDATTLDLAPGASGDATVTVTVSDYEPATGTLTVTSDDPASPSVTIPLAAGARADQDGDGSAWPEDCDDAEPTVYPGAPDAWYDGLDSDCSGGSDYDQDGDGADALEHGGGDCDDTNPEVGPDAPEVWYDGFDQDCAGDDDYDQDADGAQVWPTGADCADTDPTTTVGPPESRNGLDDDCNGEIDDGLVQVGDMLITEVMVNPEAVADAGGEWIELHNPREEAIDLVGWTLVGADGDLVTIGASLVVEPGGFALLATSGDTATNGGIAPTLVYDPATLALGDTADDLSLVSADGLTVAQVTWDRSWDVRAGASLSLDPWYEAAAADPDSWCPATSTFGAGDAGTPGADNDACPTLDHDGDRQSPYAGDCDDADPNVYYGATETAAGDDDNCNGFVDEAPFDATGLPYLTGEARSDYLFPLAVADGDGDGADELYVSIYDGYLQVWSIPVAGWESWAGTQLTYGTQVLQDPATDFGSICCDYFADWNDLDGDGTDDIPVFGTARTGPELHVFYGAATPRSAALTADVEIVDQGGTGTLPEGRSDADFDGDGTPEVVFESRYASITSVSYEGAVRVYSLAGLPSGSSLTTSDAEAEVVGNNRSDYLGIDADVIDWTGDGVPDLAVADDDAVWLIPGGELMAAGSAAVSTLATASIDVSSCPRDAQVRSFDDDGDGVPALFVFCERFARWGDAGAVSGALALDDAPSVLTGDDLTDGTELYVWPADVDGDGWTDLRVSSYASSGRGGTLLYGLGADDWPVGTAAIGAGITAIDYTSLYSRWGPAADLDGDGDDELTLGNSMDNGNRGMMYVLTP